MYKLDLKKLDNPQGGISALSTCQRDFNDESSRISDQPLTVLIKRKEKKEDKTELLQIQQQKKQGLVDKSEEGLKDKQYLNNQPNSEDNSISADQNNYKDVINKYVNSLNKVLSNQEENKKSNLIVPRKQMYQSSLPEESQCSYYDSEENSQIQNNYNNSNKQQSQYMNKNELNGNMKSTSQENSNQLNGQQIQLNNSFKSKNQLTKAQQLNLLLQGSTTKGNEKQNQMLQSSQCQQSEYAEGDEHLDENYSYYEVSFNHNENKQPKQSQSIQNQQKINNQMSVQTTNLNQMQKNQTCQQKFSKDKLASLNQSIQQSIYAKSIENKSSLNPKALNNSLMNEEKLQAGSIAEKCCKICLEGESTEETGQLLSPCRCNGSMQYIHEECLKTWLVSQQVDIDTAACELCKMEYNMEIIIGKKFQLTHACQEGQISFASCLCLFILVAGMLSIIFLFAFKWNVLSDSSSSDSKSQNDGNGKNNQKNDNSSDSSSDNSFSYQLSILIACVVILIVILVLFIMSIKEAFFVDYMKKWRIYNFDKETTKKKKKSLNQKEKAQLNQQAATNARVGNVVGSQTINNQSILRNQRGHRLSQQSQQINSLNQQNEQIQNYSHVSNINHNQTQNQSFDQQRQQQINIIQEQINRVSEQYQQQGEDNSNRQKLYDQTIINNLINDQSLNESYLNSTVLQLKANQNLNDSQTYKKQYNVIDVDKEKQMINELIGGQDEQKDDYSLKQYSQQKQDLQDSKYAAELQKSQKGTLKIISSVSKIKKSHSNLSKVQQTDKYTIKPNNNNNQDGTIIKSSIVNQDDNYQASIQRQSINKQIIGDELTSQDNSIDPSQYINKINKLLNDIPRQFQDVEGKQDIIYNVLITKPIKK
ncbi:zinc finger protein (macronuclear) [Tetrahymena thermophila SB210]|uniref:Zinc finger protein n=1 Tax=Tetrahymena thermophila (strain SB210) TaxID=312017 RepID=I7ME64_TETTS|nr:zinc finger protein [Tetrahymena thermophila SB210]EAR95035.2 zinc finger protein [Tetrahymena thermophila SB210]|eukprot:XP_001015280.2 zinc finger protein [Tetrahymena thermophila SB210]